MVEIPKQYGKIMIAKYPQYVIRTVHKRHYYMVDSQKARQAYERIVKES